MRAEKVGSDTLLARIIRLVAEAQRSRAPIQNLADQVSSWFVPAVVFISLITFFAWFFLGPEPSFLYGLANAIAVLIIACPCALGLATPMSVMVGIGKGAEEGVLVKNARSLEILEKIDTLLIDKTGTLTEGKPSLSSIFTCGPYSENEMLRLLAALEQLSEHPIAETIVRTAKEKSLILPKVEAFESRPGQGISGKVEKLQMTAGKLQFLRKKKKPSGPPPSEKRGKELEREGHTVIFAAIDGQGVGLAALKDPLKKSTKKAIQELKHLVQSIIILSGDTIETVSNAAKELEIEEAHGAANPFYKEKLVQQYKEKGRCVAMAGDGINDAPALAAADVGIAMGTGTDAAIESADIALIRGDLTAIARAIRLSRAMMKNIRQNLFFAFIDNILGIAIAAGLLYPFTGLLLNPMIAALAMSLSSVSVILNSLRLRTFS